MARQQWPLWWLGVVLSAVLKRADSQVLCDEACNGCGTATIDCRAYGLTQFPVISAAERQLVESLTLSANQLQSLSVNDFANFTSLEELYISSNNIQTIEPGTFSQTTQLEEVSFDGNNLQEIPEDLFTSAPNLEEVDFRDNNIDNIPEVIFSDGLASSVNIDLSSNPLHCDCGLRWLPDIIDSPEFTGSLTGMCSSPSTLSGTNLMDLTEDDLTCDCSPACVNGTCDLSVGQCTCNDGYTGDDCSSLCSPRTYGAGCLQNCSCVVENEASPCNFETGACYCLPGYTGNSCQDVCPMGSYGQDCVGQCQCQNGALCDSVTGDCNCTTGTHCNISSCNDGILNNNETGVDCGGDLCPLCQSVDTTVCTDSSECDDEEVCLGQYTHMSNLLYPFTDENKFHCVDEDVPGEAIFQKFKEVLLGREGALPDVNPQANISEVVYRVQQELEIQFRIEEPLGAVEINDLEQEAGDPLYQTSIEWSESTTEASVEGDVKQMITNINSGKLKGTLLINREDRKVILNI